MKSVLTAKSDVAKQLIYNDSVDEFMRRKPRDVLRFCVEVPAFCALVPGFTVKPLLHVQSQILTQYFNLKESILFIHNCETNRKRVKVCVKQCVYKGHLSLWRSIRVNGAVALD